MTGRGPLLIDTLALWSGLPQGYVAGLLAVVLLLLGWALIKGRR